MFKSGFTFDNSYARDLPGFAVPWQPATVPAPRLLHFNPGLARELGLTTVAEGIENAEVARRLADFGCDVGQGFFFSAPVPADEALRLLHDTRRIPDHSAGV